jgi:hypothetical protein
MPARRSALSLSLSLSLSLALALGCASSPAPGTSGGAAAGAAPTAAVFHDVQVTLVPEKGLVLVDDEVTLSAEARARLGDEVVFSLHSGLSPERTSPGAPLARTERAVASSSPTDRRAPTERFLVTLRKDERTFTVHYGGPIVHALDAGGEEYARKNIETVGLVSKEGAFLSGASEWLPRFSDDLVAFSVEAHVPAGWDAVSQGGRARHERDAAGRVVRWECPVPQEEVFLVAGPWSERARQAGKIAVQVFLREDDPALAERYLAAGAEYLAMYERLLGPYPYPKFAVVENFWETGFGMPSFTLLGGGVMRLPFILRSSYPHEILHDWWGNGVFVDPRRGNWSEGLTAYLADHLAEEQEGRGASYRRTSLQRFTDYVSEHKDFPVAEFRERHGSLSQAVGYDKVLLTFHMLRERLGDERFVRALRALYEAKRYREASFSDVQRAMEAAAGEDLGWFFSQWVDRPGAPALRVDSAKVVERGGARALELALSQTQAGTPYVLDVPVALTVPSAKTAVRRTVRLAERTQTFSIPVDEAPVRVDVDPEFDVFRRLDPTEVPPALSGFLGAPMRTILIPAAAPPALRQAYWALAEAWRRDGTQITSDAELWQLPPGRAVLVLGWENRFRGTVAQAIARFGGSLDERELRGGGAVVSRAARSAVAAARRADDPALAIAFVATDRAAALPGLARKLPHYGKYGLLGFEGDEPTNVTKASWTEVASPLAVSPSGGALPGRAPLPARPPLIAPPQR